MENSIGLDSVESTIAYKNLISYSDILKFVLEMRAYIHLVTNAIETKLTEKINVTSLRDFYSNDESLLERITVLLGYGEKSPLSCAAPINSDMIIKRVWTILPKCGFGSAYSKKELINKRENEVKKLEEACPNIRLLIIELMEFVSNLDLSTDIGRKIKSVISEYLRTVNYSQTPTIRDYLNQKCTVSEWYESYFILNVSATGEEGLKDANENFNALLSSILTLSNDDRLPVLKHSLETYYAKIGKVKVSSVSLNRLLTESSTIDNVDYILLLLKKAGLLVDIFESVLRDNIIEIVDYHLTSRAEDSGITNMITASYNLWTLFMRSKNILPLEDVINIFANTLGSIENIDSIIINILSLLEKIFPNHVAMFKEQLKVAQKGISNGAIELQPKKEDTN